MKIEVEQIYKHIDRGYIVKVVKKSKYRVYLKVLTKSLLPIMSIPSYDNKDWMSIAHESIKSFLRYYKKVPKIKAELLYK